MVIQQKKRTGVVILIVILLAVINFMNTWMVFQMTSKQTKETGIYQLEMISAGLEHTIRESENLTIEMAIEAREYLDDRERLEQFIVEKKAEIVKNGSGAFNLYIAGMGWDIIPDFVPPDGFVSWERQWYTGALRNGCRCFVTSPYVDLLTGDICYTVSVMLGDRDTVLGIDFTVDRIQEHIRQMDQTGSQKALIVTESGIIAGCLDEKQIGEKLSEIYPEYAGIFSLAKSKKDDAAVKIKSGHFYTNLFAARSENNWYLIVSENDWELYKYSYIQLFVTVTLSLVLFGIIVLLYVVAARNQKRAESAIESKEKFLEGITDKLQDPLRQILESSRKDYAGVEESYQREMDGIREAGQHLSEMIGQIMSYSSIVRTEKTEQEKQDERKRTIGKSGVNKRFRLLILAVMLLVVGLGIVLNVMSVQMLGYQMMQRETESYEDQLAEWINTQKSILDMFCSVISTHPEMLEDYEGTVEYLNRITRQYPEISVSYMTNPELKTPVIMSNGWKPDGEEGSHPDERQWYIDLMASDRNWIISAPYYDLVTGLYCVTFAERVYDDRTGEFIGNFGIDFIMDDLIDILGDGYSDTGYAFLADADGDIINHPYGSYQMSESRIVNTADLPYAKVDAVGDGMCIIRDYDQVWRILTAAKNKESNFTVYVAANVWKIYGRVFIYGLFCLVTFTVCLIVVYRLLTNLIGWQEETNRQIKASADAAIAGEKAKGRFLAQMSHEIRTPINAVLGMNEMILRESKDTEILDYAVNIRSAGQTLLALINSILDFSKLEDGKMEIVPVNYDLAAMVHNLVVSTRERAQEKHLELAVEVQETLPAMLRGDDMRISQVILNLLTNAVKYTDHGQITLSIRDGGREADRICLEVAVRDTGIGIRQRDMEKLFDSFSRLDEARNRNIEGTGLGMSIVTGLLAMMDSELKVESKYGEGSVFSFRLEQVIVDASPIRNYEDRVKRANLQPVQKAAFHASEAKVLVVDDNEMNLKVAKNLLKLYQVVPELVTSGAMAIERIREQKYDIVFMDHMMPGMDGIETLEELRKQGLAREGMSIIALTANAVVGAQDYYLKAGFDDYLSKPIEAEQLERLIKKYISANRAHSLGDGKRQAETGQGETDRKQAETGQDETDRKQAETGQGEADRRRQAETGDMQADSQQEDNREWEVFEFSPAENEPEMEENGFADVMEFPPEEEHSENRRTEPEVVLDRLRLEGIQVQEGIRFCGSDIAFYMEMLQDYMLAWKEKSEALSGYYEGGEWKEYQTLIHSLKSASKTIGADGVSLGAKELEEAAGKEDIDYILTHHAEWMKDYGKLAELLRKIL